MAERNDGGPAFPRPIDGQVGMSLRDYFAAAALPGLIQQGYQEAEHTRYGTADFKAVYPSAATLAYKHADAMLEAREKEVARG